MNLEEQLRGLIELAPHHIQRHFACDCAERVLQRVEIGDNRSWNAIKVSRLFAEGEATIEELAEAWAEAWAAALGAECGVWGAPAASAAAQNAAWVAAQNAAQNAAWATTWATTRDKEREWQIEHLQSLIAAHNAVRSSLLFVLQKRAESIKPVFVQYVHDLEERVFE